MITETVAFFLFLMSVVTSSDVVCEFCIRLVTIIQTQGQAGGLPLFLALIGLE